MLNLDIEEVSTISKVNYCVLTPELISSLFWMNNRLVQNVTVRQKVIKFFFAVKINQMLYDRARSI
jgi:hypothetical protein